MKGNLVSKPVGKLVRVVKVIRKKKKAISVRMQYIYLIKDNGTQEKILHDVEFVSDRKGWVKIKERIVDNYLPPKRYMKMARKAVAIIYDKKVKKLEQLDLPLK